MTVFMSGKVDDYIINLIFPLRASAALMAIVICAAIGRGREMCIGKNGPRINARTRKRRSAHTHTKLIPVTRRRMMMLISEPHAPLAIPGHSFDTCYYVIKSYFLTRS